MRNEILVSRFLNFLRKSIEYISHQFDTKFLKKSRIY